MLAATQAPLFEHAPSHSNDPESSDDVKPLPASASATDDGVIGAAPSFSFPESRTFVSLDQLPALPDEACPSALQAILRWLLHPDPKERMDPEDAICALQAALYGPGFVGLHAKPSLGGSWSGKGDLHGAPSQAPLMHPASGAGDTMSLDRDAESGSMSWPGAADD